MTVVLAGLAMIGPFATDTYLPSFPAIAQHFSVNSALLQQTLSAYLFAYAFMSLWHGTLSDAFGRRPVVLISLLVFTVSSIGAATATSFTSLLVFRALQGSCAGAGMTVGQAIVRDWLEGPAAQRMLANIMMVFGIAPAVAPIVGGLLQVHFDWRSNFFFMGAVTLFLLVTCLYGLPESIDPEDKRPFNIGKIAGNFYSTLMDMRFLCGAIAIAFCFGGFALYIASAANFVLEVLHLRETEFAWLFIPMIGGIVIGSATASRLTYRMKPNRLIRWGFSLMAIGAIANLSYMKFFLPMVPWATIPIMFYTFGMAIAMPGMMVTVLEIFPKIRGMCASIQSFIQMLVFALVSGWVSPLLFGSGFNLAIGMFCFLALSAVFWQLSRASFRAKIA